MFLDTGAKLGRKNVNEPSPNPATTASSMDATAVGCLTIQLKPTPFNLCFTNAEFSSATGIYVALHPLNPSLRSMLSRLRPIKTTLELSLFRLAKLP